MAKYSREIECVLIVWQNCVGERESVQQEQIELQ